MRSWRLLILTAGLHCCLYGRAVRVHHPLRVMITVSAASTFGE
jgi:hypothetical protein